MKCRDDGEGGGVAETDHERGSSGKGLIGHEIYGSISEGKVTTWVKMSKEAGFEENDTSGIGGGVVV